MSNEYTKVVYGNARLVFTLKGTEYTAVRDPRKIITLITNGRISRFDYEAALLIALDAFARMDKALVFSMEKTDGSLGNDKSPNEGRVDSDPVGSEPVH